MKIVFNNGNNPVYENQLNDLLKDIFLDFQFWYDLKLWDNRYESYAFMDKDSLVANISVYKSKIQIKGKTYEALSVGSVATRENYRGQGLARKLMTHVMNLYPDTPMYLSANDTVMDFYPHFGFKRIYEKQPQVTCAIGHAPAPKKLVFKDERVVNYVRNRINFSHRFDCLNTESIQLFHIHWGYLKEYLYELEALNAMVIAEQTGTTLKIYGLYALKPITFKDFITALPFQNVETLTFGFTPHWEDLEFQWVDVPTDPLFIRGCSSNLGDFKFPELSIT